MNYKINDMNEVVLNLFHSQNIPTHRYASFDYCYNYFQNMTSIELKNNMEKSCLQLGFYLASWGMLRGSSFLLQKSVKHYEPLINYLISLKEENNKNWTIDVDEFNSENIDLILEVYKKIQEYVIGTESNNRHIVLVTKIMMGVFGCIPAYDQYFTQTFRKIFKNRCGFRSVNEESILCLKEFCDSNIDTISNLQHQIRTMDFNTTELTKLKYSKAKIIDMYGFAKSFDNKIV